MQQLGQLSARREQVFERFDLIVRSGLRRRLGQVTLGGLHRAAGTNEILLKRDAAIAQPRRGLAKRIGCASVAGLVLLQALEFGRGQSLLLSRLVTRPSRSKLLARNSSARPWLAARERSGGVARGERRQGVSQVPIRLPQKTPAARSRTTARSASTLGGLAYRGFSRGRRVPERVFAARLWRRLGSRGPQVMADHCVLVAHSSSFEEVGPGAAQPLSAFCCGNRRAACDLAPARGVLP